MPEDGSARTARLHGSASLHLRALKALHESLFAPCFRALETYGEPPPPPPSLAEVVAAARAAMAWHQAKARELEAEVRARRAAGGNAFLLDEAARTLAHHREERVRIETDLAQMRARISD